MLVAIVATVQQSIKNLSPVYICTDADGDWYNYRRNAIFVSSEVNVSSWRQIEENVLDLWCHSYHPRLGDTVVDIGAGIGDDVLAFSRMVGQSGRVIAVEAHPKTYRCMTKSIKANGLKNVIAINAAVSESEGFVNISDGDNILSNSTQVGQRTIKVRARTMENILREVDVLRVDLIKMNIEGAETNALRGMTHLLNSTSNLVVSCHDFKYNRGEGDEYRTYEQVYQILKESNYRLSSRDQDSRPEVPYYIYAKK